jgi:serpin B
LLGAHPGNQVVSPVSISAALTLLSLASGGETRRELETVLGLAADDQQRIAVAQALAALGEIPPGTDPSEQVVRLANALWTQKGLPLKPAFTATMRDRFGAPVREVDFTANSAQAVDAINKWASEQTNGRIPKVFAQLDPTTVVVLANALYAKLTWLFEADPTKTANRSFN